MTPTQSQTLNTLEALLSQETQTYQMVAGLMDEKKEVLVKGNYKQLPDIDQRLVQLGQQSITLEQERLLLMQQLGYPNQPLSQMVQELPPPHQSRLSETRARLKDVVEQINELNQTNKRLLHWSIKWIEETVDVITNAVMPESASYTATGDKTKNRKRHATQPTQSTFIHDA